eukprot:946026-Prorocentrum_minimum.AAC.1
MEGSACAPEAGGRRPRRGVLREGAAPLVTRNVPRVERRPQQVVHLLLQRERIQRNVLVNAPIRTPQIGICLLMHQSERPK